MAALACGCRGPRYGNFDPALAPIPAPRLAILYYPYGPSLDRTIAEPVPDYTGWPEERMVRDMQRLERTGVDIVLMVLDFNDMAGTYREQQHERFVELAAEHPDWPRLAYWVYPGQAALDRNSRVRLSRWILAQTARQRQVFYELEGRPLVVLSPEIRRWPYPHPGLTFRMTSPHRKQWTWPPPAVSPVKLAPNREQCLVYAGWKGEAEVADIEKWILSRRHGQTLRRGLRRGIPLWTDILCIDSWNNYSTGSFIEPNALDGTTLFEVLQDEVHYLHKRMHDTSK